MINENENDDLIRFLSEAMEEMETWTCEEPQFLEAVGRIAENLAQRACLSPDDEGGAAPNNRLVAKTPEDLDDLIRVAAYLRASPSIRLLYMAGKMQPGIGTEIISRSANHLDEDREDDDLKSISRVVLDRILILARADCYTRIFGPDRRSKVLHLLESLKAV